MVDGAEAALDSPRGRALIARARPFVVPNAVAKELIRKHSEGHPAAERALRLLKRLRDAGDAEVWGEERDKDFADPMILSKIQQFRTEMDHLLLTQDRNLANEAVAQENQLSVRSRYRIFAVRTTPSGLLQRADTTSVADRRAGIAAPPLTGKFALATQAVTEVGEPVGGADPAQTGSRLQSSLGEVTLRERLGGAGEGVVYRTSLPSHAAKIFNLDKRTKPKLAKLELMLSRPVALPHIAWPVTLLSDAEGTAHGFLMPLAEGLSLDREVLAPAKLRRYRPSWTRRDLVRLARDVARLVAALHNLNVVIGDLNPANFVMSPEGEPTLVDADSFQIEGYPSGVGRVHFMAPELQGMDWSTALRTKQHDLFALATLIFMILMPGKPPYSQQGGGDVIENVRAAEFPYRFGKGDGSPDRVPQGPWRMVWSHFPHAVKQQFCAAFGAGDRPTAQSWVSTLEGYLKLIDQGHSSDEVFPQTFKQVSDHAAARYGLKRSAQRTQVQCGQCGNLFNMETDRVSGRRVAAGTEVMVLCNDCERKYGETISCSECGTQFLWSIADQRKAIERGWTKPKRCRSCIESRVEITCDLCYSTFKRQLSEVWKFEYSYRTLCYDCASNRGTTLYCRDCGSSFLFSYRDQRFYEEKGHSQPTRCKHCRERRKQQQSY